MGAKQSKRSVDISGKEAESAGEVAAAIAGGEGRVEQLADADALKPQLNGDAYIHETEEEKKKDIDIGTPENEKDATTEKEAKQPEEEKEVNPLTNGESEQKVENGESTPTLEDGKKPKKEKVKKKWSLRSISFSRKDKPKQEKKQKEEEPKTNGEPEKVPEETAEVPAEVPAVTETAEEAKTLSETKEDKTPETPVTEPITNGSSTPESPKVETPVVEEPEVPSPEERPEPKVEIEPEQLPVNGLSLQESVKDSAENENKEDSKEELIAETKEIVPEIPAKKEVCVEQMPLIDSTPPPLPANPPPSSVASFAATTMAPELTDASLANTADNAIPPPPSPPSDPISTNKPDEISPESENDLTVTQVLSNDPPLPVKEANKLTSAEISENKLEPEIKSSVNDAALIESIPVEVENVVSNNAIDKQIASEVVKLEMPAPPSELIEAPVTEPVTSENLEVEMPAPPPELSEEPIVEKNTEQDVSNDNEPGLPAPPREIVDPAVPIENDSDMFKVTEIDMPTPPSSEVSTSVHENADSLNTVEDLPSPPPPICDELVDTVMANEIAPKTFDLSETSDVEVVLVNSNNMPDVEETSPKDLKTKLKECTDNTTESIECNGNIEENSVASEIDDAKTITNGEKVKEVVNEDAVKISSNISNDIVNGRTAITPEEESAAGDVGNERAQSGAALRPDQEPVSDKLADLIPEVPEVPELTETLQETTSDVAVAN